MAFIGWIISFVALLGGLALRQDMPMGGSVTISNGLFALAVIACPMIWRDLPVSRGQRIAAGLALVLSLPMVLMPG